MISLISFFDLFCGAGNLSDAYVDALFKLIGGLDFDKDAINTFNYNFNNKGILGNIEDKTLREKVIEQINQSDGHKGVIGGAPCQSYSLAGNRDVLEKRAYYFEYYFEIVRKTKPDFFVFENVRGITSMKIISPDLVNPETMEIKDDRLKLLLSNVRRYKDLKRFGAQRELINEERKDFMQLSDEINIYKEEIQKFTVSLVSILEQRGEDAGYNVVHAILNAKDFGSAQSRERFFLVGIRKELNKSFVFPEGSGETNTVKSVLHDLEQYESMRETMTPEELQSFLESKGIYNHIFTKHSPDIMRRIAELPQGETLYKNYSDAWWRLKEDGISRCVKENHNGCHIHYKFNRVTTPRELARLQGFDDNFKFVGKKSATLKMIGNAVDKYLGTALANAIKKLIEE